MATLHSLLDKIMRFKEFIQEDGQLPNKPHTSGTTFIRAVKWVKEHAPQYARNLKNNIGARIYRGAVDAGKSAFQFGDTSTFKRRSANTENYYTTFIATSDKWSEFPSREHAFICADNKSTAISYGRFNKDVYLVIPADNARLGICPTPDIWSSFSYLKTATDIKSLSSLNQFIKEASACFDGRVLSDSSSEFIRKTFRNWTIKDFDDMGRGVSKHPGHEVRHNTRVDAKDVAKAMLATKSDNFEEFLEEMLDPKKNGFHHTKAADFKGPDAHAEIWVQGEALFVRMTDFEEFLDEL